MVAVIHSGSSLRRALNYHEQKVRQEAAVCIAAVNYPKDAEDLTFYQKLNRLQNQENTIAEPAGKAEAGQLQILLQPENSSSNIPYPLSVKGRKKKKKGKSKHL